jgi:predicted AAA+ superfamily ATPase
MAHFRKRYLQKELESTLKFSPIVGILGHRQVGKTTLMNQLVQSYASIDLPENRKYAAESPESFISSLKKHPAGIDECQVSPDLFPVLKEMVRRNPKPGQYILSGSVRFTSRRSIRESLTGRIINLELLPFTVSELLENQLNQTAIHLHENSFQSYKPLLPKILQENKKYGTAYIQYGGLPGLCFIRNKVQFARKIETHLETILERDLQLITRTQLRYTQLRALLVEVATQQGSFVHYGKIAEKAETNIQTVKKILDALVSLFMIRILKAEGGTKSNRIYLEDLGESHYLMPNLEESLTSTTLLAFAHIKTTFQYQSKHPARFYHYHTRGGVQIPICVEANQKNTGFLPIEGSLPSKQEMAQARSYLASAMNSKMVFLTRENKTEQYDDRVITIPVWSLL